MAPVLTAQDCLTERALSKRFLALIPEHSLGTSYRKCECDCCECDDYCCNTLDLEWFIQAIQDWALGSSNPTASIEQQTKELFELVREYGHYELGKNKFRQFMTVVDTELRRLAREVLTSGQRHLSEY